MRRTSVLIGICMIAAMMITLYAQQRDGDAIMKDVGQVGGKGTLSQAVAAGNAADVAKEADKLQGLFREMAGWLKAQKATQGVDMANSAAGAAGEVAKAAKANDMATAKAKAGELGKACKACHDVYREKAPDGSMKFKANPAP